MSGTAPAPEPAAGTPRVRPARPDEAELLTALVLRSKAHWGYDAAFMAACRDELAVTAEKVAEHRTAVVELAGGEGPATVAGMVTVEGEPPHGAIGMLFVDPGAMGRGVGRLLYGHALRVAAGLGITRLSIDADPYAEAFYRTMGAVTVGRVPSGSVPGRTLPLMEVEIAGQALRATAP
ncbi:GNAT family N-acetyltransferase [Actinacidiphila acidipaludis]|uniref:GNAT family N-acetyltransferase n=1 Tax=Actinacidiphila acidipaludis TaxID=2873382 RepID=A0ABS7QD69_9ACTN|nr:GNAT family N-acetyltransferase [Streptomyces acidipaludis]MBY8881122.1 GNAT family N-acetyltransferase [Streptomyces acidipaludis]